VRFFERLGAQAGLSGATDLCSLRHLAHTR
jgi:hypothetical protein